MATKFGLAGGIPERRVRPIWDAVDSRQYKPALKLAVGLLAKYPNSPYALALKALILERMGKLDEALNICLDAKNLLHSDTVVHIDDLTLSTLQIVFQRLDRIDLATSCYEHACGKYPNNLEMMIGLFNCYVREYAFVKQQQTAIKMYKMVSEERFLLWAVCSIQLQVSCSNDSNRLLQLAEALLKKHIASHSLHEPEALTIYISILEQQAKYDIALEVLSGNLGSLIGIKEEKLRIQGRLLARACNYAAAAEVFQKVLQSCPDDWDTFLHYLDCLLENDIDWSKGNDTRQLSLPTSVGSESLMETHLTEEVFNSRISSALLFVQKLQLDSIDSCVRGPFLASIEIQRRRRLHGEVNDSKLIEALLDYFQRFSHLSCFLSDMEMFLHVLNQHEKAELLEKFAGSLESVSVSPVKALGRAVTVFRIQELFGSTSTLPSRELHDIAKKMLEMYCENLVLSRDLDPQENMHGEELLSMACNILVLIFWRSRNYGYLLEAIMILEFGLNIRRYVWQYKMSLLHLYVDIGALPLAYEWYSTLDVKNILLETTSHHILPHILKSPLWKETGDLLKEYLKFMDDHLREAADLAFLAYRYYNYSKVIEFVQFKEHLERSAQLLKARLDASILQLKQRANNVDEVESFLEGLNHGTKSLEAANEEELKSLVFNEDFQTRPWWTPTPNLNHLSEPFTEGSTCLTEKLSKHKATEQEGIMMKEIERKSLLPRLIYLAMHTASLKDSKPNGSLSGADATEEQKHLLERYARNLGFSLDDAINVTLLIFKGQKLLKDLDSDAISWINFAVFVNAWNCSSHHLELLSEDKSNTISWQIVDSLIKSCIAEQLIRVEHILAAPGSSIGVLSQLITETFSWHMLVIQSCLRSMHPSGKKKKRSGSVDHLNSPHMHAMRGSVQCLIDAMQCVRTWVTNQMNAPEDQDLDDLLSCLQRNTDQEPGTLLQTLEDNTFARKSTLGERISGALESWSSASVGRKITGARRKLLGEFLVTCDSKMKVLETLRQST